MEYRNYIIQLADGSSFYVNPQEGIAAQKSWANGNPILIRNRAIANHMVSIIRPCVPEENQQAEDYIAMEDRTRKFIDGKLQIQEKIIEGEKRFAIVDSVPQLHDGTNRS